ncbi:unnamed protein product, partial [Iphiclides podalirius]
MFSWCRRKLNSRGTGRTHIVVDFPGELSKLPPGASWPSAQLRGGSTPPRSATELGPATERPGSPHAPITRSTGGEAVDLRVWSTPH